MKNLIYISIIVLVTFSSCVETIEIDLDEENLNKLVVEGRITTEQKAHEIKLSRTASYFSNIETPRETDALVSIIHEGVSYPLLHDAAFPGVYKTDSLFTGKVGHEYTLSIVTIDGEEYMATAYLDTVPDIDSIGYYYQENIYYNYFGGALGYYVLSLYANEPQGKGNIFMFEVYFKDEYGSWQWYNDTLVEAAISKYNDDIGDGLYLDGFDFFFFEQDNVDRDSIDVKVNVYSISEGYSDFTYEVAYETDFSGGMIGGIPANVASNMNNGALGFFYAGDISSYEFSLKKDSLHYVMENDNP